MNLYQQVVTVMFLVASLVTALYLCGQFAWLACYEHPKPREESLGYRLLFPLNLAVIMLGASFALTLPIVGAPFEWSGVMFMFSVHVMTGNLIIHDLGNRYLPSEFEGGPNMASSSRWSALTSARITLAFWLVTGLTSVIVLISLK